MVAVFVFVLGGDVVYFGHVHRHAGPETWAVGDDLVILLSSAIEEALLPIFLAVLALVGLGYGWHHLIKIRADPVARRWPHGIASFVIFAALFIVGRGGVTKKPLNIVNAFEGVSVPCGYLALNGPFSINHSLRSSHLLETRRFPHEEAVAEVRRLVASERDEFVDASYPLLRDRAAPPAASPRRRPNVVILLLESWDSLRVDCTRKAMGLEPYGATPNFDAFCARGALFTRFYATGQRSVHGIAAILAGVPAIPGMPYIGLGLEQNRLAYLGRVAKRHGYSTHFLQASPRRSYRCEAISSVAGFDHYYGAEDMPATDHAARADFMGAWDYDLFMKANDVFASACLRAGPHRQAPKPFMGLVFTLSTHSPYDLPHDDWLTRPADSELNRYLNALAYSDWALGEFLKKAEAAGYFKDTIFVAITDHVGGRSATPGDYPSYHLVPLAIVAPGLEPGVRDILGGQTDLFPTIMDLAGWGARHATVGRSLFDETPGGERFAMCLHGEMLLWIEGDGWLLHDLTGRRASHATAPATDLDLLEKRLLSTVQVMGEALRSNTVFRPAEQ
jgi:membrane-anchored protein YejM (alkaline phosphatase superfamily)